MKAILLARVSSREQQEGMSIPAQERRLQEYAARKGLQVYQVFAIAESSTKDTRKEFQKILELIQKSKEPIALVADTVDRVQRGFKESVVLEDLRKEGKVEIHFIREGLVLNLKSNSSDILRWDMGVMFARSYVLQLSDNIKRAKEQSARNGIWMGLAPTGYIHSVDEQGNKTIIPDPALAPFITKMFELYATGSYSLRKVQEELTAMGVRAKSGKPLAISQINKLLKKPFYAGTMETKYGVVSHHYECLTTPGTFKRVQEIIDGYQSKPHKTRAKPFILKGMITCAHCGCVVTPEIKKKQYIYYSCTNGKGGCKRVYVREEELLKPLLEYFDHIALNEEQIETITEYLREIHHSEARFHKESMTALRKEQDRVQRRISQIYDDKLDGVIDEVMYLEKVKEYKARQVELIEEMKRHETADQNFYVTANMVLKLASRARELFESSEVDEKRQLLNLMFQNLKLDGKNMLTQVCEPFNTMIGYKECPTNWRWRDSNTVWVGG
jgi:site-specific DNA recombinase